MYLLKRINLHTDLLLWDDELPSCKDQYAELRIGSRSLYVAVMRFKQPLPANQCAPLIDFTDNGCGGLQFTLLRRWHFQFVIAPSSLGAELDLVEQEEQDRAPTISGIRSVP